eukprot:m.272973 g.272973  ORF g.272973 m.272973 type:complete len:354 (+) comp104711_c0_seq1:349-1410(+)
MVQSVEAKASATVEHVLSAAAALVGSNVFDSEAVDAAVSTLKKSGIVWSWQMACMGPLDWTGVPAGLKCSAMVVLERMGATSTTGESSLPSPRGNVSPMVLTKIQRRFLLFPDPDGEVAPLRTNTACFGLVAIIGDPAREAGLFESGGVILGLISGLLMSLPLELMRGQGEESRLLVNDVGFLWGSTPSSDQLFNGLCLLSFALLFVGALMSLMGAAFSVMFGKLIHQGQEVISFHLGVGVCGTVYGAIMLIPIIVWMAFDLTHPVIAVMACGIGSAIVASLRVLSTIGIRQMPLLVFQLPLWCRIFFLIGSPTAIWDAWSGKLRVRAEEQATELREHLSQKEASVITERTAV